MPSLHWCFTIKKPKEVKDFDPTAKANFWSDILPLKLNGGLSPWTTGVKKRTISSQKRLTHPKALVLHKAPKSVRKAPF